MGARFGFAAALAVAVVCGLPQPATVWAQAVSSGTAAPAPQLRQLPPLRHRRGHSPCAVPPNLLPYAPPPPPLHTETVPPPAKAVAEDIHGCAGVRFHITPDGKAHDITVMMEFPSGYGFADVARQVIATATWAPRQDSAWHYINLNINPAATLGKKPN